MTLYYMCCGFVGSRELGGLGQEKKFSCLKGLDGPILAKIGTMLYFELF